MSPLPERRKSAGEIARLRESIGVPQGGGASPDGLPVPRAALPARATAPVAPASSTAAADPVPPADHPARPVAALRPARLEAAQSSNTAGEDDTPAPRHSGPAIPTRRHDARELETIRRRQALAAMQSPVIDPRLASAHPAILAPGYLLALAGATCHLSDSFPAAATGGSAFAGLLIAALVCWKFPSSRHHAAFMAVAALFVLVFGTLHFLPQFQHAP